MTVFVILLVFMDATPASGADNEADAPAMTDTASLFGVTRRRDQYGKDFAYFAFPFASRVPGYGSAYGGIAMAANIAGTDTDAIGFYMTGDFRASGLSVLDLNAVPRRLIVDIGLFDYKLAFDDYTRGIDSDPDYYTRPEVEGRGVTGQATLTFLDRMIDTYARYSATSARTLRVFDVNNNEFASVDTSRETWRQLTLGLTLDITDDRLDPRRGWRLEASHQELLNDIDPIYSTFAVQDVNITAYVPIGGKSTWVFNFFRSDAIRQSTGSLDRTELSERFGLACETIADPAQRAQCEATESQRIDQILANNLYGYATPLGGTQRLRSYVNGRYSGGHSVMAGTEFRWNLTEERTLMNWYFLKGIRTNIQAAFFVEAGSVADHKNELYDELRYSYGTGLRVVFSGAVLRLDVAHGSEGVETQLFLNYPWSMFSVDSPG